MTLKEVSAMMEVIRETYPDWKVSRNAVKIWADFFVEDPAVEVMAAVKMFIATDTKGFAPSIGQIRALLAEIREANNPDMITEAEATEHFYRMTSNGLYGAYEEFEKLPPILQRVVKTPKQIEAWSMLEEGLYTVALSQYLRAFRVELQRAKTSAVVPASIQKMLGGAFKQIEGGIK